MDEIDPDGDGLTRWERLKADLASPAISDDHFRCILGEEVTLAVAPGRFVHMLACGGLEEMIEGAFLPRDSDDPQVKLFREMLEKILRAARGYPQDIPQRLFGRIHSLEQVLAMLPDATLAFAAHPFAVAQVPPARWDDDALAHPRLAGFEFWNGRERRNARMTDNPFALVGWNDQQRAQKRDQQRIAKLMLQAQTRWDPYLQRGVDEWRAEDPLPARRPVFIGGSDAHGDFNYHVGCAWDYSKFLVNDNALGKVRTAIEVPGHSGDQVPDATTILASLKKGACVITDGPILQIALRQGSRKASMGEILSVEDGDAPPELKVIGLSSPEFGPVQEVEVVTYFQEQTGVKPRITTAKQGVATAIELAGCLGYCRVQAKTIGATGEQFCCFTNPIWIKCSETCPSHLRLHLG